MSRYSNEPELIEIYGTNLGDSRSGLAIWFADGTRKEVLPKSQLEDWPDSGKTGECLMPEWLAKEKGFI